MRLNQLILSILTEMETRKERTVLYNNNGMLWWGVLLHFSIALLFVCWRSMMGGVVLGVWKPVFGRCCHFKIPTWHVFQMLTISSVWVGIFNLKEEFVKKNWNVRSWVGRPGVCVPNFATRIGSKIDIYPYISKRHRFSMFHINVNMRVSRRHSLRAFALVSDWKKFVRHWSNTNTRISCCNAIKSDARLNIISRKGAENRNQS